MSKKYTKKEIIEKFREIHKNRYQYKFDSYKGIKDQIDIICKIHGSWKSTPDKHLRGRGCPKCAYDETSKRLLLTTDKFIKKSKRVHGSKYDYSKSVYEGCKEKITIICKIHGPWKTSPRSHLIGSGCPKCAGVRDTSQFIEEASKIHNNRYDYSKVIYNKAKSNIIIICLTHGEFKQTPNNHLNGQGCPSCAKSGFDPVKPAALYYVRINKDNEIFYKIGITNRKIRERFSCEKTKITELMKWEYPSGKEAKEKESQIKELFKNNLYNGPPVLKHNGNREIFDFDVLGYDI